MNPAQNTDGRASLDAVAEEIIATRSGVGMAPPFYAETASAKGDENWPLWIVRNKTCNSLGRVMSRAEAEALAPAMNRAAVAASKGSQS